MSNIIVMAFSPRNIIGCFLKKGLQRGGRGVTGTPGPPPHATSLGTNLYSWMERGTVRVKCLAWNTLFNAAPTEHRIVLNNFSFSEL